MLDHPSWQVGGDGRACRAVRSGDSTWIASASEGSIRVELVEGRSEEPVCDVVDPAGLTGDAAVVGPLQQAGSVVRLRNPDLWDALATAIVRQVIRADQARKLYRAFCRQHGVRVGDLWLFPTPETVLSLSNDEFTRLGMAFKRRPLCAAAEAYLDVGAKWNELDPKDLLTEVQNVPRIGPWTAGAAVSDVTNNFALYPYADLAVRTWATRLAPGRAWPLSESDFSAVWRGLAGEQLSAWTLLTLAWGVRNATRGAI